LFWINNKVFVLKKLNPLCRREAMGDFFEGYGRWQGNEKGGMREKDVIIAKSLARFGKKQ